MKTLSTIFICILSFISTSAQFICNSTYFTDLNTGYAVGVDWNNPDLMIFKTTNGGTNWEIKQSVGSCILYSVYFPDSSIGYAVGEDLVNGGGVIMKTTDAGQNWNYQFNGNGSTFRSTFFINRDTGFVIGEDFFQGNRIIKTTNGGITWINQTSNTTEGLKAIFFLNDSVGYCIGSAGTILKTTNAGGDWVQQDSGVNEDLQSVFFTDLDTGYAAGNSGTIIKTTNGGIVWESLASGTSYNLNSIYFTNSNNGFVAGDNGTIVLTIDGGINWMINASGTTAVLSSIYFPDSNHGYISSKDGIILKTTDGGNSWFSIQIKSICLLSPNGGENWSTYHFYNILWTSYAIPNVRIELSLDNGLNWEIVIDSLTNTNNFNWYPQINMESDECLIKIIDVSDSLLSDISNANFRLFPEIIDITSPNGGEIWPIGSEQNITWIGSNDSSLVKLKLSKDNGINWTTIKYATYNSGIYSWTVSSTEPSSECLIKIETVPFGYSVQSDSMFTISNPSSIKEVTGENIPDVFNLYQNYPNPFNPTTKIRFTISDVLFTTLKVYDVLGNGVATLVNQVKPAGTYVVLWNAGNLPSGVYFYQLQAGYFVETKKMILLK